MTQGQSTTSGSRRRLRSVRTTAVAVMAAILALSCLPALVMADGVSISGTFVSSQGSPVANVNVTLLGAVSTYGGQLSVTTDSNGAFAFTGVANGTYGISFSSDGSCGGTWTNYYIAQTGVTTQEAGARPFTLSGADLTGIAVTCPQTHSISGHVYGPTGKPLANITVEAGATYADTLADGSFTIASLDSGSYWLFLDDESGTYQSGYAGPSGLVHTDFEAAAYTLGASDLTGIKVTLPKALTISGRVTDAQGNPLAGLDVAFSEQGSVPVYQRVATGTDGSFTIPGGVPQQSGDLVVTDPNGKYAPGMWSRTGLTAYPSQANLVSLGAGSVKHLGIVALPGLTISGTTLAPDSTPLPGVTVYPLLWANGAVVDSSLSLPVWSQSGSDGAFSLTGLAPAKYVLQVQAPSGASSYYSTAGLVLKAADATPVDLTSASASGLTIQTTQLGTPYTVSGTLHSSDGNPVANAWLELQGTLGVVPLGVSTDGSGSFSVGSVPSGSYTLRVQPADNRVVGGFWTGSGVTTDQSKAATITVTADTSLSLTIPVAEHITGRVVMPSGIPMDVAAVEASSSKGTFGNTSWQPGGAFDVAVPAGSYRISIDFGGGQGVGYYSATSPGSYTFNQALATMVGSTGTGGQGITIVQPALPQIAGRLLDNQGKSLGSAFVYLYKVGSSDAPVKAISNPAGWFAVNAAPGSYRILVGGNGSIVDAGQGGPVGPLQTAHSQLGWYSRRGTGHFTLDQAQASVVRVGSSGISGISVRIPNTVAIGGTVTGPNRKGIWGIRAEALDPTTGAVLASGITAANGTYSVRGLNSGSYEVRFVDPAGAYNTCYVGKKGTVDNIAQALVIKLATANRLGVDGALSRTKK